MRGQKCLKRRFLRRSPVGEWSRGARSMPRVFGRGSRSQPAALVSDRADAALFPAIRILEGYGSAKSSRARRVRTACRRRGDPKRSSTICCRSFGLRARPSKAGPSPLCLTADAEKPPAEEIMSIGGAHGARKRNRAYLPRLPLSRGALYLILQNRIPRGSGSPEIKLHGDPGKKRLLRHF